MGCDDIFFAAKAALKYVNSRFFSLAGINICPILPSIDKEVIII